MKEVIIGGTLEAFFFAYLRNIPVYYGIEEPSFFWEESNIYLDYERFFLPYFEKRGDLWRFLYSLLSLSGLNPFPRQKTIKIKDNKLFFENEEIEFDVAYVFSDRNIENLPEPIENKTEPHLVVDFFNKKRIDVPKFRKKTGFGNFFNEVMSFPTLDYERRMRFLVKSFLSLEERESEDFSLFETTFLLTEWLKDNGYFYYERNGVKRFIKVFPIARESEPINKPVYENTEHLKFFTNHSLNDFFLEEPTFTSISRMSSLFLKKQEKQNEKN